MQSDSFCFSPDHLRHLENDLLVMYNKPTSQLVSYTQPQLDSIGYMNDFGVIKLDEPSCTNLTNRTPSSLLKFCYKENSMCYVSTNNTLIYAKINSQADIDETDNFKSKNFKEFVAPYKQVISWCTLIDGNRAIAVTQQGEFYYIDFTKQETVDSIIDQDLSKLDREIQQELEQEENNFNKDVKGINFMSLRDSEEATEISTGFREIVISACQNYMAFLFVNKDKTGNMASRVEVWMTGDWNFMNQEIYKIQEFEIDRFASILDFSMWVNHSQTLVVGEGTRRVNDRICYETVKFYSVNDGKLSGELPGMMMGMQPFVKNYKGEYLTTLFSESGDEVALMILRVNDLS